MAADINTPIFVINTPFLHIVFVFVRNLLPLSLGEGMLIAKKSVLIALPIQVKYICFHPAESV